MSHGTCGAHCAMTQKRSICSLRPPHLPFGTTSPSRPLMTCSHTSRIHSTGILQLRQQQYTTYGARTMRKWLRTLLETPEDRTRTQRAANEKAHNTNEVRKGLGRQWEDSPSNGTRCEHKHTMTNQGRVEMRVRVATKGAKSCGRVGRQEVAAR